MNTRKLSRTTLFALAVVTGLASGCAVLTSPVQRQMEGVYTLLDQGAYERALERVERAQDVRRLSATNVAETTLAKARCLEGLGRTAEATAHYRFVVDHHPHTDFGRAARSWLAAAEDAPTPEPAASGPSSSDANVPAAPAPGGDMDPAAMDSSDEGPADDDLGLAEWGFLTEIDIQIPGMQYPERAVRKQIQGEVEVAFQVEEDGEVHRITVLNQPHPLLLSEVIRAVAHAELDPIMLGLTDRSAFPARRRTKVTFDLTRR